MFATPRSPRISSPVARPARAHRSAGVPRPSVAEFLGLVAALTLLALAGASPARGAGLATELTVHVLSHDAKLVGTAAGGAEVIVRERDTGVVLARGIQRGDTGSTAKIVEEPWVRGQELFTTEGAARFTTTLELERPTWIEIEARGPLGFPGSTVSARRTLLLVPGRHVGGDGVVLTLQGLVVQRIAPSAEAPLEAGRSVEVRAGVKLLCTCPIYEGSLWDAADYEVSAELWDGDVLVASAPLSITDEHNVFAGEITPPEAANASATSLELRVVAGNPATGNWGLDRTILRLRH